jgi:hypothetical protein
VGSRSRARARAKASQAARQQSLGARRPAEPTANPAGRTQPDPTGRTQPDPAGRTQPDPAGRTQPDPAGRTQPDPTGRTLPGHDAAAASGQHPRAEGLPRSVLVAAVAEAVVAAGILVASVLAAIATAKGHSYQDASGIAITLIGIGTAVALALVARALRAGRRWSRTPAMLTQLFTGIVAIYLLQSGRLDWGIPAIVLAITGFGALLTPASIEVLTPGRISKS